MSQITAQTELTRLLKENPARVKKGKTSRSVQSWFVIQLLAACDENDIPLTRLRAMDMVSAAFPDLGGIEMKLPVDP